VFRELVNSIRMLNSPYVMSIPAIRSETMRTHAELRQALYTRQCTPNTYVTIEFDGWTNCNSIKVTNVMAISHGIAYYIKSIPNASERNTAEWLNDNITPVIDELIAGGVKINAVVTDNGSVESSVRHSISEKYKVISIPCAAHTLQLVVHFIMMKPEVNSIISFFASIVSLYLSQKSYRIELMSHSMLKLRKHNTTRWNTVVIMLERIRDMKNALNTTAIKYEKVKIDDDRWSDLNDLLIIFSPFKSLTDLLQADHAMLSVVYHGFDSICEHTRNVSDRLQSVALRSIDWKSRNVSTSVIENIKMRYHVNIEAAAVTAVHLLTRSPARATMSDIEPDDIRRRVYNSMSTLVSSNIIERYTSTDAMLAELARQWTAFQMNNGKFMTTSYEQINSDTSYQSLRAYWTNRLHHRESELLAIVALAMLAINPSEASVERSFSQQKLTHSSLRNRLADEIVEAQMFIKMNAPLLTSNDMEWNRSVPDPWYCLDPEGAVEGIDV
jgi:hypothetical protein